MMARFLIHWFQLSLKYIVSYCFIPEPSAENERFVLSGKVVYWLVGWFVLEIYQLVNLPHEYHLNFTKLKTFS